MNRIFFPTVAVLLLLHGTVMAGSGGFLGVRLQALDEEIAEQLDYQGRGVYVMGVVGESPAEKAGIKDKDVIVEFDGDKVVGPGHLKDLLGYSSPGDKVKVKVWRDNKTKTMTVELAEAKSQFDFAKNLAKHKVMVIKGEPRAWLGIKLQDLSGQLAEHFGVEKGILISEVFDDSPAAKADIAAGDVITKIDEEMVEDPFDLTNYLSEVEPGSKVRVTIIRSGKEMTSEVELGETPEEYRSKGPHIFQWTGKGDDDSQHLLERLKFPDLHLPDFSRIEIQLDDEMEALSEELKELKDLKLELKAEMDELREEMRELKKELTKAE